MIRDNEDIRKILVYLTQQAKDSGSGEFRAIIEFLTDAFESERDNNSESQNLLIASCDEIISLTEYIKQELS